MQYAVRWIWDMAVTTFLFSKLVAIVLRIRGIGENRLASETQTSSRWVTFGLLSGMIGLLNSTLLLFVPVCGIWMLLGVAEDKTDKKDKKDNALLPRTLLKAVLAGAIFTACLAPWMWRNWEVFHAFVPLRGNFGAELYASAAEGNEGFTLAGPVPICAVCPEYLDYKRMGEVAYVRRQGDLAKKYIRAHKMQFAELALKRFYFYWVSVPHPIEFGVWNEAFRVLNYSFVSLAGLLGLALALKQHIPGSVLFAWAFALVPLVYYFVTVQARFRHPIEPLLTILGVFLFQSATTRKKSPDPQ
jgi:hypothetical protein